MNQYGWCVMNKDTKGEQCTILWHLDDIKTPRKDPKVVTTFIDIIRSVMAESIC